MRSERHRAEEDAEFGFTTPPLNKDYSAQMSEVRVTHPYIVFFFCCPPPSERHNLGSDPPGKGRLQN